MDTALAQGGASGDVALRVEGISKAFGTTRALNDVTFDIKRGEIHALMGNNGSGKSTLIKILAGVYAADEGTITIGGTRIAVRKLSPKVARKHGLHFVHQTPPTFPMMTVADNLAIGHGFLTGLGARIRRRDQELRAIRLMERFRIAGDPDTPVAFLRPADRMLIAIARALQDQDEAGAEILILDEPTAALPALEVNLLLGFLKRYAEQGKTIIYVSHRLDEILRFCDRVSALRDGCFAGTQKVAGMTENDLVTFMLGSPVESLFPPPTAAPAPEPVLVVQDLRSWPVWNITFELNRGEILGLAGLIGSGKSEVLRMLFGVREIEGGRITVNGAPLELDNPRDAIHAGMAYIPPDRGYESAFRDMSLRTNISAVRVSDYWEKLLFRHKREKRDAINHMARFLITGTTEDSDFFRISGGNQQKAVLARWLSLKPKILLVEEPTQGVAIGARADIYGLLRRAAGEGVSMIVASSDFEELARLCDRVLVMNDGKISAEVKPPVLNSHRLTELAHFGAEGKL